MMMVEVEHPVTFVLSAWHWKDGSRRYTLTCECHSILEAVTPGGLGLAVATHIEESHS